MPQKTNVPFYAKFSAGKANCGVTSGWSCKVINEETDAIITVNTPFTEIVENISSPRTAIVASQVNVGSYQLTLTSSNLQLGDCFADENNNIYYITKIVGNTIYLAEPTTQIIPVNANLLQVGNTGIYKVSITIATEGKYIINISNPTINAFNVFTTVEVYTFNIKDINSKIDTIVATQTAQYTHQAFV